MAGASDATLRITHVNLNWTAALTGTQVEALIVTEDEARHEVHLEPSEVSGFLAMTTASSVLLWDSESSSVIAANIVGDWISTSWSGFSER